jgi:hypothetical protein
MNNSFWGADDGEIILEERLSQSTEFKPEPESLNVDTSFFNEKEAAFTHSADRNEQGHEHEPTKPKVTESAKRGSARVAVGMLDLTLQSILTPLHGWKFKRKFKKSEIEKLDSHVADSPLDDLEADERKLKVKWERLIRKHEKKVAAIPMSETERTDLEDAFYQYLDIKEKTLPSEWFIGMGIINVISKRVIDVAVD